MSLPKFRTMGLTHLALAVRDVKKSVAFYSQVFGMTVMYEGEDWAQLQTPGTNDILVFEQKEDLAGRAGGIQHFGFRLHQADHINFALEAIHSAGGKIKEHGEFVPGEPYVFFYDPDGYEVEIWYEKLDVQN